jgi:hypothetical protein
MVHHPLRVIGCLVCKGEGSSAVRGVVVGAVARAALAPARFRLEYADGTQELVDGARVQAMLADGERGGGGGGAEEAACPVCFDAFGADGGVRPSILECGHIFCRNCVQCIRTHSAADTGAAGTTRRGTCIRCPLCQARHRVRVHDGDDR